MDNRGREQQGKGFGWCFEQMEQRAEAHEQYEALKKRTEGLIDKIKSLKVNESEVRRAASRLSHVTCEDWYDAGYAIGRAKGWNAALDAIKKHLEP